MNIRVEYIIADAQLVGTVQAADGTVTKLPFQSQDNRTWSATLPDNAVRFRLHVERHGEVIDEEMPDVWHDAEMEEIRSMRCLWQTNNYRSYRYSTAFRHLLTQADDTAQPDAIRLIVHNFLVPEGYELAIVGAPEALGCWQSEYRVNGYRQSDGLDFVWIFPTDAQNREYKFILVEKSSGNVVWEDGENRTLPGAHCAEEVMPRLPQGEKRITGVVIPIFSLRSKQSWGVGDFGDLQKMIDWVAATGMHLLQVLPVNDTSRTGCWTDSYPYNGISAFALHPIYADLNSLGELKDKAAQAEILTEAQRLNRLETVDYEAVITLKMKFLQDYYNEHRTSISRQADFKAFKEQNKDWLLPYCQFRALQEAYGTADFRHWPACSTYKASTVDKTIRQLKKTQTVAFYAWTQFVLDNQLKAAHQHARCMGVALKGDIPIGICRDSATAWLSTSYFHFDGQAGAPPDFFSKTGQNWGFPTYNWENLMADGGSWWRRRLQKMADYFDAFRIDHVLGFFRIWEIPQQYIYGTLGHFNPALPLSEDEIRHFGFKANISDYLQPVFNADQLKRLFGTSAESVRMRYFEPYGEGLWTLRAPYLSQRQIADEVADKTLRARLMDAVSDVLFMKAADGGYHPNIAANKTRAYQERLSEDDRVAYNHLSDDFFYHRHDAFWTQGALAKLDVMTDSTRMLVCAEDLGMIPACMREVLGRKNILSLEVESMPKYSWGAFANVADNPLLSVDTITTHDMAPLRLWWRENRTAAQTYFRQVLHAEGEAPLDLTPELCRDIIKRHLQSPSILCVLALQDWLGINLRLRNPSPAKEQINNPAVSNHYWRYRMHLTIEQLLNDAQFTSDLRQLQALSHR